VYYGRRLPLSCAGGRRRALNDSTSASARTGTDPVRDALQLDVIADAKFEEGAPPTLSVVCRPNSTGSPIVTASDGTTGWSRAIW
jgi:hypothetical protein